MTSPKYLSQRVRFVQSEDGSPLGATSWFGSERSATVETEQSAIPRRGVGNKNSHMHAYADVADTSWL